MIHVFGLRMAQGNGTEPNLEVGPVRLPRQLNLSARGGHNYGIGAVMHMHIGVASEIN